MVVARDEREWCVLLSRMLLKKKEGRNATERGVCGFVSTVANPLPPSAQPRLSLPPLLSLDPLGPGDPLPKAEGFLLRLCFLLGTSLCVLHVSFIYGWETIGGTLASLTFLDATRSGSTLLPLFLPLSFPFPLLLPFLAFLISLRRTCLWFEIWSCQPLGHLF